MSTYLLTGTQQFKEHEHDLVRVFRRERFWHSGGSYGSNAGGMNLLLTGSKSSVDSYSTDGYESSSGTNYRTNGAFQSFSQGMGGGGSMGSTSMSGSVLQTTTGLDSYTGFAASGQTQTSMQSTTKDSSQSYSQTGNSMSQWSTSYGYETTTQKAATTVNDTALDCYTTYQSGSFANGSYSLSSVSFSSLDCSQQTAQEGNWTTTLGSATSASYQNSSWATATDFLKTGGSQECSQSTYTVNDRSTSVNQRYASGSYANGSYGLGSVSLTVTGTDSNTYGSYSNASSTSSGTDFKTSSTIGTANATMSSTQIGLNTATQQNTSAWTITQQGTATGGMSFSFGTVTDNLSGSSTGTVQSNGTIIASNQDSKSGGAYSSGTKSTSSNGTTTNTSNAYSFSSFSLNMTGSAVNGVYAFSNATAIQFNQQTVTANGTSTAVTTNTRTGFGSMPIMGAGKGCTALSSVTTGSTETKLVSLGCQSSSTLTENGSYNGSWNLSSVVFDSGSLYTFNVQNYETVTEVGVPVTGSSSTESASSTYLLTGTQQFKEHDEGTYGNNSSGYPVFTWSVYSVTETATSSETINQQSNTFPTGSTATTSLNSSGYLSSTGYATSGMHKTRQFTLSLSELGSYSNGSVSLSNFSATANSNVFVWDGFDSVRLQSLGPPDLEDLDSQQGSVHVFWHQFFTRGPFEKPLHPPDALVDDPTALLGVNQ